MLWVVKANSIDFMKYLQLTSGCVIETDSPEHWPEGKPLTKKAGKAAMVEQSRQQLLKWLKPGDTVHTVLRHVSSSGMSRRISVIVTTPDGPLDVSGYVAQVLDMRRNDRDGSIVAGGCGMDMGFSIVYNLGYHLWPKGTAEPHGKRNGEPDSDGGYALKHRWL